MSLLAAGAVLAGTLAGCSSSGRTVDLGGAPEPSSSSSGVAPSSTASVQPPATPGKTRGGQDKLISVGGVPRRYRIHVPITATSGPRPMIIALHALGADPQRMEYTIGLDNAADRQNVYVVYPEGVGGAWNNGRPESAKRTGGLNDVAFLAAVIKDVQRRFAIDKDRILIVGHGDGGLMASIAVGKLPDTFSGLVLVSAQLLSDATAARPTRPIATMFVHGTHDPVWPFTGSSDPSIGNLESVDDTMKFFLGLNKQSGAGVRTVMPDRDPQDGTRVNRIAWSTAPTGGAILKTYLITNGGFPWPGGTVSSRSLVTKGRTSRDLDTSSLVAQMALEARRGQSGAPIVASQTPSVTPTA